MELSDEAHQVDQAFSCERRLYKMLTAFDPGIVTTYWPALRSLAFSCTAGTWDAPAARGITHASKRGEVNQAWYKVCCMPRY